MSKKQIVVVAIILLSITVVSWIISLNYFQPVPVSGAVNETIGSVAGGAELAPTEGETDWSALQENLELGQNLTEIFRGHFSPEFEKSNPEWVQATREAFAKFEGLEIKEAHIEPELGVTSPAAYYSLTKADSSKIEDEVRELATFLPFAMILNFDSGRTIRVKTANPEQISVDLIKSFSNVLTAIVNREESKTGSAPILTDD
jgi:hypothetical protein